MKKIILITTILLSTIGIAQNYTPYPNQRLFFDDIQCDTLFISQNMHHTLGKTIDANVIVFQNNGHPSLGIGNGHVNYCEIVTRGNVVDVNILVNTANGSTFTSTCAARPLPSNVNIIGNTLSLPSVRDQIIYSYRDGVLYVRNVDEFKVYDLSGRLVNEGREGRVVLKKKGVFILVTIKGKTKIVI